MATEGHMEWEDRASRMHKRPQKPEIETTRGDEGERVAYGTEVALCCSSPHWVLAPPLADDCISPLCLFGPHSGLGQGCRWRKTDCQTHPLLKLLHSSPRLREQLLGGAIGGGFRSKPWQGLKLMPVSLTLIYLLSRKSVIRLLCNEQL